MSDWRPALFPKIDAKEAEQPTWLERGPGAVLPPPFMRGHVPANDIKPEAKKVALPSEPPPAPEMPARSPSVVRAPVSVAPEPRRSQFPPSMPPPRHSMPPQHFSEPPPSGPSASEFEFAQAAMEMASTRPRILAHVESDLLSLAVRIAEAIIGRELRTEPGTHLELARSALEALGDTTGAVLRASPRSYEAILSVTGEAKVDFDGTPIDVVRDPNLDGLGCVAEGASGQVDARVEERLAQLFRAFVAASQRKGDQSP